MHPRLRPRRFFVGRSRVYGWRGRALLLAAASSASRVSLQPHRLILPARFPFRSPSNSLAQAGHDVILQVESDERCASVLRAKFPHARLERDVAAVRELPAETEVLAAALPWPENDDDDDDDDDRQQRSEQPWLPASRAAAAEEHAHIFRLLAGRPVSWVVLELPVSLLRWATAAVPGGEDDVTTRHGGVTRRSTRPSRSSARIPPRRVSIPARPSLHPADEGRWHTIFLFSFFSRALAGGERSGSSDG